MLEYLKARLAEPTTKAVLGATLVAVGAPVAAGADLHTCVAVALGAALPAIGGALTKERADGPS